MEKTNKGLFIALGIIGLWGLSLSMLLRIGVENPSYVSVQIPIVLVPLGMLCQTFLYTGLFITAHDAMHGSVCPAHPRLNNLIGSIAVRLYALFSYRKLLEKHWEHHRTPASDTDPDFHDGQHTGFLGWYFHFMREYLSWQQIIGMAIVFQMMEYILAMSTVNLILFWVSPALLSTVATVLFWDISTASHAGNRV